MLADHGDTVAMRYLYLRPRNLDRRNGFMRVPTVDTGEISVARETYSWRTWEKELRPMDDKEFNALRLRASLCPGAETDWAPAETTHWIALHACKDELRSKVSKTLAALEAVNADKSLSFEGKKAAKAKLAAQSLDELEQAKSLTKAEAAVRAQLDRWAHKIAAHVKPAEDHSQAVLAAQIRQRVSDMRENRLEFLRSMLRLTRASPRRC